ncbi:hypothetical protein MVEN_01283500 [Mycena venus]|uniref:Uncharacterized protein n=1 Tax=Mycena venus TaxID=2733690 RepID=A0A8H6XX23_9AGAR|nr:hypothetical protein MVEN_01283500 [Mycena venus]
MWKDSRTGAHTRATQRDPAFPVESQLSSNTRAVVSLTSKTAVAGLSMGTCATASGSFADIGHTRDGSSSNMAMRGNSPSAYGMEPIPNPGSSIPTTSNVISDKSPVRLVGRGGQGSRPRVVSARDSAPAAPGINRSPPVEIGALSRGDSTRIVGRGGMGSRPRDLPAPARVTLAPRPPPTPTPTPTPLNQPAAAPMLYRPGGRGGAGSKPRMPKPPSEARETGKSSKFPWKGKGKEARNASTYGMPSLSRTDTVDSTESGAIHFLPARRTERTYQTTVGQDPIPEAEIPSRGGHSSSSSIDASVRRTPRLHKFLWTLGAEVMSPQLQSTATQVQRETKASRRSSVSGKSIGSNVDSLPDKFDSRTTEQELRRCSSYESLPSILDYQYPSPPRPPPAFPNDHDSQMADDSQSESLTYASTEDHSELCTISSTNTDPLQFNQSPSLLDSDAEDDYEYPSGRSPTPTRMTMSPNHDEKHFSSVPFASVLGSTPAWESADGVIRDEIGWTGEWNCSDIQEVISSLRELRL